MEEEDEEAEDDWPQLKRRTNAQITSKEIRGQAKPSQPKQPQRGLGWTKIHSR